MRVENNDTLRLRYGVFLVVGLLLVVGGFVYLFSFTLKEDKPGLTPLSETEQLILVEDAKRKVRERERQAREKECQAEEQHKEAMRERHEENKRAIIEAVRQAYDTGH